MATKIIVKPPSKPSPKPGEDKMAQAQAAKRPPIAVPTRQPLVIKKAPPASNDRGGDRIVMPAKPPSFTTPYRSSVSAPTLKVAAPAQGGGMAKFGGIMKALGGGGGGGSTPRYDVLPASTQAAPTQRATATGPIITFDPSKFGGGTQPIGTATFPGRPSFPGSNTFNSSASDPSKWGGGTQPIGTTEFPGRPSFPGSNVFTQNTVETAAQMEARLRAEYQAYINSMYPGTKDTTTTTTTQGPPANTTQISEMEQLAQLMQLGKYAKADPVVQPADTSQLDEMYKMYMQLMQQFGDLQNKYIQSLIDSQNKAPVAPPLPPSPVLGPEPLVPNYFAPSAQNGAYAEFNDIGMGLLNNMSPYNLQALRQMMAKLGYTGTGQMGRYGERTYARPGGSGNMRIADAAFEDPANYLGLPSGERENAEAALRFFLGQSGFSDQYAFPGRAQYPYPQQTTPPTPILA